VIAKDYKGNDISYTLKINNTEVINVDLDTSTTTTYLITYSTISNEQTVEVTREVIVGSDVVEGAVVSQEETPESTVTIPPASSTIDLAITTTVDIEQSPDPTRSSTTESIVGEPAISTATLSAGSGTPASSAASSGVSTSTSDSDEQIDEAEAEITSQSTEEESFDEPSSQATEEPELNQSPQPAVNENQEL
jgi:hypothetical protein